jgi:PPIC-type PPIASE domain
MTSPTSNPVVGDDRRTREGYHALMRFRRFAGAGLAAVLVSAALLSRTAVSAQFDLQTLRILVASSREQAQRLLERVRGGEDFATLARVESIDPSAPDGGLLGRIAISASTPASCLQSCKSQPALRSSESSTTGISLRHRPDRSVRRSSRPAA